MVITGDVTQVDLPSSSKSGLNIVREILSDVDDICFVELTAQDVVRNTLVGDIVQAYGKFDVEAKSQEQRAPRQLRPGN